MTYTLTIPAELVELLAELAAQSSAAMTAASGELYTVDLDEVALPLLERACLAALRRPLVSGPLNNPDSDIPF